MLGRPAPDSGRGAETEEPLAFYPPRSLTRNRRASVCYEDQMGYWTELNAPCHDIPPAAKDARTIEEGGAGTPRLSSVARMTARTRPPPQLPSHDRCEETADATTTAPTTSEKGRAPNMSSGGGITQRRRFLRAVGVGRGHAIRGALSSRTKTRRESG
ncbi:hypothetical protein BD413DRAFT_64581 [Trametes elegans]|nr:hypothetical protein BD413DRAFT_64581 [Trametes elegans]